MILVKLYLNVGVYIGIFKWNEVLVEVNDVINSGKFSLISNYLDNFKIKNESFLEEIFFIFFD